MIPHRLKLSGFLSYRDPVDVDFTSFELACISGHNGAGKSSLLDAITWALFGEARNRGEELVNAASLTAQVTFTFGYEENTYRVQRSLARGKSTVLEFQIRDGENWRPLTEATTRATQARIQNILRLDYDTFVNASFFLQGKADQFTQQNARERKRILASILGLEVWETYRERAAERRKALENDLNTIDGRLAEVRAELDEETARKTRLQDLEAQLAELETTRKTQETALDQIKRMSISLDNQRKLVDTLGAALERSRRDLTAREAALAAREAGLQAQANLVNHAAEIESRYHAWEAARSALAEWESLAARFREAEKQRQPLLDAINTERARLEQENQSLRQQFVAVGEQKAALETLKAQLELTEKSLLDAEAKVARRIEVDAKLRAERERFVELDGENRRLKLAMDELKTRIDQITALEGGAGQPDQVVCPLCGQPLSETHRAATLEELQAQGREMGDQWRANKNIMETLTAEVRDLEMRLKSLADAENERVRLAAQSSSLTERFETVTKAVVAWESLGGPRLSAVEALLNGETFAAEARSALSNMDRELTALGYDPASHEAARLAEMDGRSAEEELRSLEKARATTEQLERERAELLPQIATLRAEIENQEDAYAAAVASLQEIEAQSPDLRAAERAFYELKERENLLNQDVGMARQLVMVLDSRRKQKKDYEARRAEIALEIGRYRQLERSFGKDGVPALLIEQALPQIEEKANELLDRLSNSAMSVRFVTQAEYKDKKRDDLKETLDIQISDGAGMRDYEMFSGGEAFRVNFAIRLALSEVLARRTGARLQTLVIDEGFGSQDAQGRQRLVEAINAVRKDFAKILIITHLDELKDAFPNRIEVEKTPRGSSVVVL